jgi:hypothetical protein
MASIHFQTTFNLSLQYNAIQSRAPEILGDFYTDSSIYQINADEKTLTFTSERLIPDLLSATARVQITFPSLHDQPVFPC